MKNAFSEKLTRDITWTMGSFAVLAVSGIVINLTVAVFRDASALGVFNIAYAVYIVASQLAVVGIQYSVLRHSSFHEADSKQRADLLLTAAVLSAVLGVVAAGAVFLGSSALGGLFGNALVGDMIKYSVFGLALFPLNKVLISYLNGLRHMRAFAILQANRYILVMVWVAGVSLSDLPFAFAAFSFLLAEGVTTVAAALYILRNSLAKGGRCTLPWIRSHLAFGSKSFLAGMFVEMNSRIDVLLLGVFLDERLVGIYSFAAMLVDGIYHLLAMVRVNFNPILVATVRDGEWQQGQRLLRLSKRYGFAATGAASFLAAAAFYILAEYLVPGKGLIEGSVSLAILLCGLTIIAAFVPFDNLMLVSGHPAYQTLQHLTVVVANVALNVLLVPVWGMEGAAIGTVVGYLVGIGMLVILSKCLIGWNLFTNRVGR